MTHSDNPGNEVNKDDEFEKTVLSKVVLDMCAPFFHTGRVVNMDNYYTGPLVFMEPLRKGVFARGTCRGNRSMFPISVQFTDSEAKKVRRGSMKMATCEKEGLVAIGWVDGNPVHFLTSADGTDESSTVRQVGGEKKRSRLQLPSNDTITECRQSIGLTNCYPCFLWQSDTHSENTTISWPWLC